MARRRSSASRKSISKDREHLEKVASEAKDAEDIESRDKEDVNSGLERRTSAIQESVSSPESGVVASEGEDDLITKAGGETVENDYINSSSQPRESWTVENPTKDMARAYGKYSENTNDTPKHLYGFDGVQASSDEDSSDVDVQGPVKENSITKFHHRLAHYIKDHWKLLFQAATLFVIFGVLLAFLFQANLASRNPSIHDPHSDALKKIEEKVDKLSSALQAIANLTDSSSDNNKASISEESVQQIVHDALNRYNADKVGMADFALESSGAEIHASYHSPSYDVGSARIVLFGIPLWFDVKPPRVILQPDNTPGNCWAFKGDTGFVVIKLSKALTPTSFSMEHIPKLLSPTGDGRIPSAPKEFTVWGWKNALGSERVKLGYFIYDSEGDFLQNFRVQLMDNGTEIFQYIELRVLSNHGNPEYTCLYRFRVHGNPH